MKRWNWLLDRKFLSPWLSVAILISSIFVTYDFADLQKSYPNWSGLFGIAAPSLLVILVVAAILEVSLTWGRACREKNMAELIQEVSELRDQIGEIGSIVRQSFDGMLLSFSKRLELSHDDQVRITVYVHDMTRRHFIPCGRYSPNPNLMTPGRTYYPDREGCIGKGWDHGWHFDNDIPEDKVARKRYEKDSYGLMRAVVEHLTMLSRLYAVKRITDGNGKHLGVVVVEALRPDRFDQIYLQRALDEQNDTFASLIQNLRDYIPNPSSAEDSGL